MSNLTVAWTCAAMTKQYGLGGRVAVGHGCKYSTLPPPDLRKLAAVIADAGVAVTVLPATDLYMMGRNQDHSVQRGVADANVLVENGVNCSISSNNILNPFTPLGDGNLIRIANMQANVCQIGEAMRLRECFNMLTARSARLMNLKDYGVAVGNQQLFEGVGILEGTTIGHRASRIDGWVSTEACRDLLDGTPLADGVIVIPGKAQGVDLGVAGGAIRILGVNRKFVAQGGLGVLGRAGFNRRDIRWGRGGRLAQDCVAQPDAAVNWAVTGAVRGEAEDGAHGEQAAPMVFRFERDALETFRLGLG